MDAHERQHIVVRLAASRARLFEATGGLTQEQWEFVPGEGRWPIAHCVEHIVLVENRVLGSIQRFVEKPSEPEKSTAEKDGRLQMLAERLNRVQAPGAVTPKGTWPIPELHGEFEKARANTLRFVGETQADLRHHFFPHIVLEDLDCYQWLLLLGAHCERHVRQIEEIQATPGYPT